MKSKLSLKRGTELKSTGLKGYLEAEVWMIKQRISRIHLNGYCSFSDFILKNGREWPWKPGKLPADARVYATPQECFMNAFKLADVFWDRYTYVEGIAMFFIPTAHAWCVDKQGRVIDPTWAHFPEKNRREYYGVPIQTSFIRQLLLKTERWCGAIDVPELGYPILTAKKSQWKAKLK